MTEKVFDLPIGRHARMAWIFSAILLFFFAIFYGGASLLAPYVPWYFEIDFPFESGIPFVPTAAFVYLSMNFLLGLSPFILRRWEELFPLVACLIVETLIGSVSFLLFPVHTNFPDRHATGFVGSVFDLADTINLNGNFFPSLHVAFACTVVLAISQKFRWLGRSLFCGWATAIALSTIFMHEHHVLDVVGGFGLALLVWHTVGSWSQQTAVISWVKVEMLCMRDFYLFGQRHRRYWLIAVGLLLESLVNWRARRILRVGFCFLQQLDDFLDGDRITSREPLDIVDEVVFAIRTGEYGTNDLMFLAQAFVGDLKKVGGVPAIEDALSLIAVMRRDRCRVINQTIFSNVELIEHHRATFSLSVNLMLIARCSELRAKDVPELIDLLAWCSTVRDLQEDIKAGLINIPRETMDAGNLTSAMSFSDALSSSAVKEWLKLEHQRAQALNLKVEQRLRSLKTSKGIGSLRILASSIRNFSNKKFVRMFPTVL